MRGWSSAILRGVAKRLPTAPTYADLDALRKGVEAADGETINALGWELRLAGGESRLKEKARGRVEEALRSAGLVAIPGVPENQKVEVLVTRAGSAVERLWLAFQRGDSKALRLVLKASGESGATEAERDALAELRDVLDEAQDLAAKAAGQSV
jgi:hypothetical protein